MQLSYTEERYLKAIYLQAKGSTESVSTNAMANALKTSPAAVTDMVQRLNEKGLVVYQKYQGVTLSSVGQTYALQILRKHLLWEVFLVDKLKLGWEEVHEIAEQLEHINSPILIQRLDDYLGNPTYSPHGKAIPNASGKVTQKLSLPLTEVETGKTCIVVAMKKGSTEFLQYLNKRNIYIGAQLSVIEKLTFDQSMDISVDRLSKINISQKVSDNILVNL